MRNLSSAVWWKAVVFRMLRTAGVILTPYVPTILYTGDYAIVVSVVGFGALGSFITSLAGIAETEGKNVVWYYAIMERAVKTAAQALLTLFGTAAMFQDVDWAQAPQPATAKRAARPAHPGKPRRPPRRRPLARTYWPRAARRSAQTLPAIPHANAAPLCDESR